MRGFLSPSLKRTPTESQTAYATFSRGRKSKLAKAAQTDLTQAHQWSRGDEVEAHVAQALDTQVKALLAKKKK